MVTEDFLDIIEPGASISDERWQQMKGDADLMEACEDIHVAAHLLRQEQEDFDVEERLEKFNKDHKHKNLNLEAPHQVQGPRFKLQWLYVAAAAAVLWAVFFIHPKGGKTLPKEEEDMLFSAVSADEMPMLTDSKGNQIDLSSYVSKEEPTVVRVTDDVTVPMDTMRLTIPYGKDYTVLLPDGSRVKLHPGSRISYPTRFIGDKRQVSLTGEAYFMVAKDAGHPFVVRTSRSETRVLGTEFDVTSYDGEPERVTLISGSVELSGSKESQPVRLEPGQQGTLTESGECRITTVDTDAYTMWRDGYFYFDNMNMKQVLLAIGQQYNMSIVCQNKELTSLRVRFIAERDSSIQYILEKINDMGTVSASIEDGKIVIR